MEHLKDYSDILCIKHKTDKSTLTKWKYLNRKILVQGMSEGRSSSVSPGLLLKILFDHSGDVVVWRPGNVLIWKEKDHPGRLIPEVTRTFSEYPLDDLQSTRWGYLLDVPKFIFIFLSVLIRLRIKKIYLNALQ